MASDKLFRKPSLDVVQGDTLGPMFGVIVSGATITYLKPGKLVKMDTNDNEVSIATTTDISGNVVGIVGYEATPLAYKPATRDTVYAAGDHIAIHNTPGMRFRGFVQASTTALGATAIKPGQLLTHTALDSSGNFQIYALDPAVVSGNLISPPPLARALEGVTAALYGGTTAAECWMEWL